LVCEDQFSLIPDCCDFAKTVADLHARDAQNGTNSE
jgi:hypothetical protein